MTLCKLQVAAITICTAQPPIRFHRKARNFECFTERESRFKGRCGTGEIIIIGLGKVEGMSLTGVTNCRNERRFQFIAAFDAIQCGLICLLAQPHKGVDQRKKQFRFAVCARHLNRLTAFSFGKPFQPFSGIFKSSCAQ